jgi:hypothetical protein
MIAGANHVQFLGGAVALATGAALYLGRFARAKAKAN